MWASLLLHVLHKALRQGVSQEVGTKYSLSLIHAVLYISLNVHYYGMCMHVQIYLRGYPHVRLVYNNKANLFLVTEEEYIVSH